MKAAFLKFSFCVAVAMISVSVFAQAPRQGQGGQGPGQGQGQRMTADSYAKQKTEALTTALGLDAKQAKEVSKIYVASGKKLFPTQPAGGGGGGGRPGGGGGGMGGGGGDDFGSSASTASVNFGASQRAVTPGESDKDIANRDKKMKKLLSEDQYNKWLPLEAEFNQQAKERISRMGQGGQGAAGGQRPAGAGGQRPQ